MMEAYEVPKEQQLLCDYLIGEITNRSSGRSYAECLRNYPRDVYFVGSLRSEDSPAGATEAHLPELLNKLAPVAFGASFRIVPVDGASVEVCLRWSSYYRVFPSRDQQLSHLERLSITPARVRVPSVPVGSGQEDEENPDEEPATDLPHLETRSSGDPSDDFGVDTSADPSGNPSADPSGNPSGRPRSDVLMLRFKKVECSARGNIAIARSADGWSADCDELEVAIASELTRADQAVLLDEDSIRTGDDPYAQLHVPEQALRSDVDYNVFKRSLQRPVVPDWRWDVRFELIPDVDLPGVVRISALFANKTSRQLSPSEREHPGLEAFFFDVGADFDFQSCEVVPFTVELAPKGFRYDRHLWARPFNCAIRRTGPHQFSTNHVPLLYQPRLSTQTSPPALFASLADDPAPALAAILAAMEAYRHEWTLAETEYAGHVPHWIERHEAEFTGDRELFEEEIRRFKAGCELIISDPDVQLAFRLTNETFARSGKHTGKTGWRLFQIVFLVSQIPGLAALGETEGSAPQDLRRVDIIYFPTGGGKTEAYLSVIAFHCFLDRLRGKAVGVTAWTRFPLRLLTLQQTQRVADIICVADLVRREQTDPRLNGLGVGGFGVGYFVGKTSTPNEIVNPEQNRYASAGDIATWAAANDIHERQNWQRLIHCPSCWTNTIRVDFDIERTRIIHKCANSSCLFSDGRIPVYVVDNEIYRYLPSVLVGTIDKLAGVGNQRKFGQLFGSIDGRCRLHGYYKARCCQKDCDGKSLIPESPSGLSGPTLFVQDELHLLKEGLGTFDGHYETFVQELLKELSPPAHLKIIASSATIESFGRQIEHLYGYPSSSASIFPGPGPSIGSSFYARTADYPQRIYVGLIPHNKTIFNAVLEILEHYHGIVQDLLRMPALSSSPFGGEVTPGSDQWFKLIDLYVTSLTYFLSSRDLHSIHTDLDGHVSPNLETSGLAPLLIEELTGSTTTDDVARTLQHLAEAKDGKEPATAVLATNMVSHGVDIDRLNSMFFYGMPRQNAEYIQASSRVGRAHIGVVFVVHHPARERDQSHYGVFAKYHEYLGQLVEPVAINRWATFSINRTLPGLFMGVLLQVLSSKAEPKVVNNFYMTDYVRQNIAAGRIRAHDFIPFLERSYGVEFGDDTARAGFREEIRLRVQQFLDQIVAAGPNKKFVSEVLIPRPMLSLRDVDEPIPVILDSTGTHWTNQPGI